MNQRSLDELLRLPEPDPPLGAKIHDFAERLAMSEAARIQPFWHAVYQKHFSNMVACVLLQGDTASQRQGKDRAIHLANGQVLHIDEKSRDRADDRDILLEYLSNDRTGAPGWMECDKSIDYMAYAFVPLRRVYIFPWPQLRRAWLHYKAEWQATYAPVVTPNRTYRTYSTPVPTKVLQRAVSTAAVIQV